MSWYAPIYIYVRGVRERQACWGLVLHILLNTLFFIQVLLTWYSYYVYVFVVCPLLRSVVQVAVYLFVYFSLCLMMTWSLVQTLRTPIAEVPDEYRVDADTDHRLKQCTPCVDGRFRPDDSDGEQIEQQVKILTDWAEGQGLLFGETDHHGRIRYCYQCSVVKPDRSHHCSSCGFCVVKFDHHCPWINKCISHANYKFFLLYIFYGCLLIAWFLLTSVEAWIRYFINAEWQSGSLAFAQIVFCTIMYGVFGYYPLGELLIYHLRLIALNETTCEQAKPPMIRGDPNADYNYGKAYNFRTVFGWGLWLFPVNTAVSDGLHFPIHYSEQAESDQKICVRPRESANSAR